MTEAEQKQIDEFAVWINENAQSVGYRYEQLPSPDDYFNRPPLCGIFYIGGALGADRPWVFVHQEYFPQGDRPGAWLFHSRYRSLDHLICVERQHINARLRKENDNELC